MITIAEIIAAAVPALDVTSEMWEVMKGVMLTFTTSGVFFISRTVITMRDEVRDLNREVGVDGKNGLKSSVGEMQRRLEKLENRNREIDAVREAERQEYVGPEKRHVVRRTRDQIAEAHEAELKAHYESEGESR